MINVVEDIPKHSEVSKARFSLQFQSRNQSQQEQSQTEDLYEGCRLCMAPGFGRGGVREGVGKVGWGGSGGGGAELIVISSDSSTQPEVDKHAS